jgi:transposase
MGFADPKAEPRSAADTPSAFRSRPRWRWRAGGSSLNTVRSHSAMGYLTRPTTPRPGPPTTPNSHNGRTNNRVRSAALCHSRAISEGQQLVSDEVWAAIQPLLPPKPPQPKGGRPWIEDRAVLGGIIYVLRAGVPWRLLPARELGCGSGVTCWRRLRDWQAAGVWEALHHRLLDWLGDDGQVDWSRASIDSVSVRARRGGN